MGRLGWLDINHLPLVAQSYNRLLDICLNSSVLAQEINDLGFPANPQLHKTFPPQWLRMQISVLVGWARLGKAGLGWAQGICERKPGFV